MPVTAKLSRSFYERFGDDIVNELVEWFNMVDLTYKGELREFNELNFARFDAKLEQRLAELKADLRQEIAAQANNLTRTGGEFRTEMADLRTEMADLRTEMADLRTEVAAHRAELIKWIVGCGLGAVTVLGGLMFTLFEHFRP
jgi:hypothetical protein